MAASGAGRWRVGEFHAAAGVHESLGAGDDVAGLFDFVWLLGEGDFGFADGGFEEGGAVVCRGVDVAQAAHGLHALAEALQTCAADVLVRCFDVEKVYDNGREQDCDTCCGQEANEIEVEERASDGGDFAGGEADGSA